MFMKSWTAAAVTSLFALAGAAPAVAGGPGETPRAAMLGILSRVVEKLPSGGVRDDLDRLCIDVDDASIVGTDFLRGETRDETRRAVYTVIDTAAHAAAPSIKSLLIVRTPRLVMRDGQLRAASPDEDVARARRVAQAASPAATSENECTATLTLTVVGPFETKLVTFNHLVVTAVGVVADIQSVVPPETRSMIGTFRLPLTVDDVDVVPAGTPDTSHRAPPLLGLRLEAGLTSGGVLWFSTVSDRVYAPSGDGSKGSVTFTRRGPTTALIPGLDLGGSLARGSLWAGARTGLSLALDDGEDGVTPRGAPRFGAAARAQVAAGVSFADAFRFGPYLAASAVGHWATGAGIQFNAIDANVFAGLTGSAEWRPFERTTAGMPYISLDARLGVSPIGTLSTPSLNSTLFFDRAPPFEMGAGLSLGVDL